MPAHACRKQIDVEAHIIPSIEGYLISKDNSNEKRIIIITQLWWPVMDSAATNV